MHEAHKALTLSWRMALRTGRWAEPGWRPAGKADGAMHELMHSFVTYFLFLPLLMMRVAMRVLQLAWLKPGSDFNAATLFVSLWVCSHMATHNKDPNHIHRNRI